MEIIIAILSALLIAAGVAIRNLIRKNEILSVLYGFSYSFLIVSFFIASKSYRDSLFLNSFGKEELSI